jgi:alkyl hydroperoxide reductase subunit AhpC
VDHDVNDTQSTTLTFPIVADKDLKISQLYEMIHPSESEHTPLSVRCSSLIRTRRSA